MADKGHGKQPRVPRHVARPREDQLKPGDEDTLKPFRKLDEVRRQEAEKDTGAPIIKYVVIALVVVGLVAVGVYKQIRAEDVAYREHVAQQVADARHEAQITLASEQPEGLRLAIEDLAQQTGPTVEIETLRGELAAMEQRIEDRERTREERRLTELERQERFQEAETVRQAEEQKQSAIAREEQEAAQEEACRNTAQGIHDRYTRLLDRARGGFENKLRALNARVSAETNIDLRDALYQQINALHNDNANQRAHLEDARRQAIEKHWTLGTCKEFAQPRRRRRR